MQNGAGGELREGGKREREWENGGGEWENGRRSGTMGGGVGIWEEVEGEEIREKGAGRANKWRLYVYHVYVFIFYLYLFVGL